MVAKEDLKFHVIVICHNRDPQSSHQLTQNLGLTQSPSRSLRPSVQIRFDYHLSILFGTRQYHSIYPVDQFHFVEIH